MATQKKLSLEILKEKTRFRDRTERLDWKRIASVDIENLIHEGDTSQLADLISPVTFCKAETEFHDGSIDPGFIKVFRISQLIAECLLTSQERSTERLTSLQEKCDEMEKEKMKLSEEVLHLKETLTSAKRELKKRKEMLATSQNEILGQNNSDEYDQCPYCTKKFLTSGYLLAHIQRRHQGLPINPLYPTLPPGTSPLLCHPPQAPAVVNPLPTPSCTCVMAQLNTREHLWDEKFTTLQQDHETQIKKLRQELFEYFTDHSAVKLSPRRSPSKKKKQEENAPKFKNRKVIYELPSSSEKDKDESDKEEHEQLDAKHPNPTPLPRQVLSDTDISRKIEFPQGKPKSDFVVSVERGNHDDKFDDEFEYRNKQNDEIHPSDARKNPPQAPMTVTPPPSCTCETAQPNNREHLWDEKLAAIQQDHETQIQRLRQELLEYFITQSAEKFSPRPSPSKKKKQEEDAFKLQKRNVIHEVPHSEKEDDDVESDEEVFERLGVQYPNPTPLPRRVLSNTDISRKVEFLQVGPISDFDVLPNNSEKDDKSDEEVRGQLDVQHVNPTPQPRRVLSNADMSRKVEFLQVEPKSAFMVKRGNHDAKLDDEFEYRNKQIDEIRPSSALSFTQSDTRKNQHDYDYDLVDVLRYSPQHTPVKKKKQKYIFDPKTRKLVDVSPSSDEDDDDESDDAEEEEHLHDSNLNSITDDEDDEERKARKSQLDLVRAKTIMELEQNMTEIGLNPESTAIGLEEMGRALKHLKLQRRASGDDTHNYEQFEEERNAVKTLAKFEATKSSIDVKLNAISSLNAKKTQPSSFIKIFSAVKSSGKNWRKRVNAQVKSLKFSMKKTGKKSAVPSKIRSPKPAKTQSDEKRKSPLPNTNEKLFTKILSSPNVAKSEDDDDDGEGNGSHDENDAESDWDLDELQRVPSFSSREKSSSEKEESIISASGVKTWDEDESDKRLEEIKQYVSRRKKEVVSDTSFTADEFDDEEDNDKKQKVGRKNEFRDKYTHPERVHSHSQPSHK